MIKMQFMAMDNLILRVGNFLNDDNGIVNYISPEIRMKIYDFSIQTIEENREIGRDLYRLIPYFIGATIALW